jgi:hypothetical protein
MFNDLEWYEFSGRTTPAEQTAGVIVHNMPRISAAINLAPRNCCRHFRMREFS